MCFIYLILVDLITFSVQFFQRWEVIKNNNDSYRYNSTNSDLQVYPLTRITKPFVCFLSSSEMYRVLKRKLSPYTMGLPDDR